MTVSYYLFPIEGSGTRADPRRIVHEAGLAAINPQVMRMGLEPFALVMIHDIDANSVSIINADASIVKIPPLDNTVTAGALATVKASLEACNVPAGWVTAGMNYATIVHAAAAYCQLHQRYQAINVERLIAIGITLDTRINQLPAGVSAKLSAMADSFGFDRSGIVGATTLRNALKQLIDQWASTLLIGGEVI